MSAKNFVEISSLHAAKEVRSLCMEEGGLTLGTGTTSRVFQIGGKYPSRREELYIAARDSLWEQNPLASNWEAHRAQMTYDTIRYDRRV